MQTAATGVRLRLRYVPCHPPRGASGDGLHALQNSLGVVVGFGLSVGTIPTMVGLPVRYATVFGLRAEAPQPA